MASLWWRCHGNLSFSPPLPLSLPPSPCLPSSLPFLLSTVSDFRAPICTFGSPLRSACVVRASSSSSSSSPPPPPPPPPPSEDHTEDGPFLQELLVPSQWTSPQVALQESEWLKKSLHQWLDDEFCPEPANDEISRRCSKVYYYCLLEKQLDMGEILLQMIRELETFSFKKSFHGAFTSANAAVDIITKKIHSMEEGK